MNNTEQATKHSAPNAAVVSLGFAPEGVFAAMLVSIVAYLGFSSLYMQGSYAAFISQLSVVVCFALSVCVYRIFRHLLWSNVFRCLIFLGFISLLYTALAGLAFNNVPWLSDGLLYCFDRQLGLETFHTQIAPSLTQVRWITELLSIGYAAFIPYLCVSVLMHGTQRDSGLREVFMLSVALLYAIGFLGYLFVPAYGPIVHLAEQFSLPINGGFFHTLVANSVDQAGGPHGAFPSIHIGGAFLMCLYDFRHGSRARGWLYLPLVMLIALATVMLRYHYVVDLIAGATIAVVALLIAERWVIHRKDKMRIEGNSFPLMNG